MMRIGSFRLILVLSLSLAFCLAPAAFGQANSNSAAVTLNAVLSSSISVSTDVNSYNWASLTAGASTGAAAPVTITTTWVLGSTVNHVELDAFFATPAHAMSDGGSNYIPASAIFGAVSNADTISSTAMTGSTTLGGAGSGMTIFNHTLSSDYNSNRVDTLTLSINLSGLSIPAGTYTGTLTFQAQAL